MLSQHAYPAKRNGAKGKNRGAFFRLTRKTALAYKSARRLAALKIHTKSAPPSPYAKQANSLTSPIPNASGHRQARAAKENKTAAATGNG